jgi:general secretion pathway protein D
METFMRKTALFLSIVMASHVFAADISAEKSEQDSMPSKLPVNREGIDIVKLIEGVATRNKLRVIVDPRVRMNVTMYGIDPNKMTYRELQSVLAAHGFADMQVDGITHIVPDFYMRTAPTAIQERDGAKLSDFEIVTKVIGCGKVECVQIMPMLRPLIAQNGHLASIAATNDLLIIDRYANVKRIESLVKRLDKDAVNAKPPTDKRIHDAAQ